MTTPETTETDGTQPGEGNEAAKPTTPPSGETQQPKPEGKTYSEAEYKGLQAVIAKRDADIKQLTEKLIKSEAEKAELESNHGKVANEKGTLTSELAETKKLASSLEKEKAELQKKLTYRDIIMKDYPDLTAMSSLIPETETEEEFREKANEFRKALGQIVDTSVKDVLSGSSPPTGSNDDSGTQIGVDEVEKAYRDVVALAGNPEKTAEYNAAYDRYVAALDASQPT